MSKENGRSRAAEVVIGEVLFFLGAIILCMMTVWHLQDVKLVGGPLQTLGGLWMLYGEYSYVRGKGFRVQLPVLSAVLLLAFLAGYSLVAISVALIVAV